MPQLSDGCDNFSFGSCTISEVDNPLRSGKVRLNPEDAYPTLPLHSVKTLLSGQSVTSPGCMSLISTRKNGGWRGKTRMFNEVRVASNG